MAWYDFLYRIFTDSFHTSYKKGTYRKNALLALYNLTEQFRELYDSDLVIKNIKEGKRIKVYGKVIDRIG